MTRFLYRGNALALGGHLTAPVGMQIDSQVSVVLPTVGGAGSAEANNFGHGSLVSVQHAEARVLGSRPATGENNPPFETLAQVTLEGVDVGPGVVTADRIVARLVSSCRPGELQPRVVPVGSHFVNLRVAGQLVTWADDYTQWFTQHATEQQVAQAYAQDEYFQRAAAEHFLWGGAPAGVEVPPELHEQLRFNCTFRPPEPPRGSHGTLSVALFGGLQAGVLPVCGPVIGVAGFGRVHVGELLIQPESRRLIMLRLVLASPEKGEVAMGLAETNGTTLP